MEVKQLLDKVLLKFKQLESELKAEIVEFKAIGVRHLAVWFGTQTKQQCGKCLLTILLIPHPSFWTCQQQVQTFFLDLNQTILTPETKLENPINFGDDKDEQKSAQNAVGMMMCRIPLMLQIFGLSANAAEVAIFGSRALEMPNCGQVRVINIRTIH